VKGYGNTSLISEICTNQPVLQNTTKAHFALIFTNLFFAINLSAVKYLTSNNFIKPFGLNLIRVGISTLFFWLLFLLKPVNGGIKKKDIPAFLLCALTGVAINQLLFIKGLSLTFSIHASLLMLTTPIFITFFAAWVSKILPSVNKFAGLVLAISGALILILNNRSTGSGRDILLGDIFVIINAISYSFYFLLVKPLMSSYAPVVILRWVFTIGFFMILPFCWREFEVINWNGYTILAWINLILIVVGGTFLAYLFNVYGIKALGAGVAGAYIYTQPVMAAIIAMVFLGEALAFYKILAGILIFAGVFIANKSSQND
jgi:drug/metabolite transporter (DMT)-like permease